MTTLLQLVVLLIGTSVEKQIAKPKVEEEAVRMVVKIGTNDVIPGSDIITIDILNESNETKVIMGMHWYFLRIEVLNEGGYKPQLTDYGERCQWESMKGVDSVFRLPMKPKTSMPYLQATSLSDHFVMGHGNYRARVIYRSRSTSPNKLESKWIPFKKT